MFREKHRRPGQGYGERGDPARVHGAHPLPERQLVALGEPGRRWRGRVVRFHFRGSPSAVRVRRYQAADRSREGEAAEQHQFRRPGEEASRPIRHDHHHTREQQR